MDTTLVVPVHVDGLYLPQNQLVTEAVADYSRQPFFNGNRDVNPDIAFISESIVSRPFQNRNLRLLAGMHLHWALPDGLTRGKQNGRMVDFPAVPNRWIIIRHSDDLKQKVWVIFSDYLWPEKAQQHDIDGRKAGAVVIPVQTESTQQPYRYLGRQYEISPESFNPNTADGEFLDKLTAIGYGEPTFAAFYPNCKSVFGFHDDLSYMVNQDKKTISPEELSSIQYSIIGLYENPDQDLVTLHHRKVGTSYDALYQALADHGKFAFNPKIEIATLFTQINNQLNFPFPVNDEIILWDELQEKDWIRTGSRDKDTIGYILPSSSRKELTYEGLNQPIEEALIASLTKLSNNQLPSQLVCYAHFSVSADFKPNKFDIPIDPDIRGKEKQGIVGSSDIQSTSVESLNIALAENGMDALTTYLSQKISPEASEDDRKLTESRLQRILLNDELDHRKLDLGPKFNEVRHEQGFNAFQGGYYWMIHAEDLDSTTADAQATEKRNKVELPSELEALLFELNDLQEQYDVARTEIDQIQRQLFADWYKYMLSAYPPEDTLDDYPDVDEIRYFIEQQNLIPLQDKFRMTGELEIKGIAKLPNGEIRLKILHKRLTNTDEGLFEFLPEEKILPQNPEETESLADQIEAKLSQIINQLNSVNQSLNQQQANTSFVLKAIPSQQYWQPKEPSLFIAQDKIQDFDQLLVNPTGRYGKDHHFGPDNLSQCYLLSRANDGSIQFDWKDSENTIEQALALGAQINNLLQDPIYVSSGVDPIPLKDPIAFKTLSQPPWHPIFIEWEVELAPLKEGGNQTAIDKKDQRFESDFITGKYRLNLQDVDISANLSPHEEDVVDDTIAATNLYNGRSPLSDYHCELMKRKIVSFLEQCYERLRLDEEAENITQTELFTWSNEKAGEPKFEILKTAVAAYNQLGKIYSLTQSIGGFNQALLMFKQTRELLVDEPIGFDNYRNFTQKIGSLLGDSLINAPRPLTNFNPIQSGDLKILKMHIIDTFGRVKSIDLSSPNNTLLQTANFFNWSTELRTKINKVRLIPRLMQPARLDFKFYERDGLRKINSYSKQSPICGWLLTNQLDNSIAFYDTDGRALGYINAFGDWSPNPGSNTPLTGRQINKYMLRLINYLITIDGRSETATVLLNANKNQERKKDFIQNFISAIDSAMRTINPERFSQQNSMALLVGRPIALVRSSINFQLQGQPAIDQSWAAYRERLKNEGAITHDFTQVKFPIRIGEYKQLNDGLVGYWIEKPEEADLDYYEKNLYYSLQGDPIFDDPLIITRDENATFTIEQAIDDAPHEFSMLMDPAGVIHASCGILPTNSIQISSELYEDALSNIEVSFLTAPIITQKHRLQLPIPEEPGYTWSYVEQQRDQEWREISYQGRLSRANFSSALTNLLFESLKKNRWVTAPDPDFPNSFDISSKEIRQALPQAFAGLQTDLHQILDDQLSQGATFMDVDVLVFLLTDRLSLFTSLWTGLLNANNEILSPDPNRSGWALVHQYELPKGTELLIAGVQLEVFLESILANYTDRLDVPEKNAILGEEQFTIREGWLRLRQVREASVTEIPEDSF